MQPVVGLNHRNWTRPAKSCVQSNLSPTAPEFKPSLLESYQERRFDGQSRGCSESSWLKPSSKAIPILPSYKRNPSLWKSDPPTKADAEVEIVASKLPSGILERVKASLPPGIESMRSFSSSSSSSHGFGPSDAKTEPDVTEFSMPSFELKFDWISNVPQHSRIKNHTPSRNQSDMLETVVDGLAASGKSNLPHPDIFASLVDEVANPKSGSLHGNAKAKKAVSIVGVASRRGYRFDGNESDASQKPGSRALKPSVALAASNTSEKRVDVAAHTVQKKPVPSQQYKPSPSLVSKTMQNDQEANPAHHKQEKESTYLRGHTCGNTTTWVASAKKDRPAVAPPNFSFLATDGVYAPRLTAVSRTVIGRSVPAPQIASNRDLKAQGAGGSNGPTKSHASSRGRRGRGSGGKKRMMLEK
ncbi:hypothetical protein BJ741DRAFT_116166 [Chytriomyces cf. hyalinus JEL632]|nr:hypothetical protein BJ741DRAFT_116166 [Chytriomyces cf. hyalinus JEL632]